MPGQKTLKKIEESSSNSPETPNVSLDLDFPAFFSFSFPSWVSPTDVQGPQGEDPTLGEELLRGALDIILHQEDMENVNKSHRLPYS